MKDHSGDSLSLFNDSKFEPLLNSSRIHYRNQFLDHFKAILFRKTILFKRSVKSILVACVGSVFFCGLAIILSFLMSIFLHDKSQSVTFKSFPHKSNTVLVVIPKNKSEVYYERVNNVIDIISEMFYNDTEREIELINFSTREELNEFTWNTSLNFEQPKYAQMGMDFSNAFNNFLLPYNITIFYNASWSTNETFPEILLSKALWKYRFGVDSDFKYTSTLLLRRIGDIAFSLIGPCLICCGLTSMIPLFIFQPITDHRGDVRSYMESCSLTTVPYWLATFIVDFCFWFAVSSFSWLLFFIDRVKPVTDNAAISYYVFVMSGPSFILSVYIMSFMFKSAESAPRQAFIMLVIMMLFPIIVILIVNSPDTPLWTDIIFSFIPHLNLQCILQNIFSHIYTIHKPFSYYFTDKKSLVFIIQQVTNLATYSMILMAIEKSRKGIEHRFTKSNFNKYSDFFREQKKKHPVTEEAVKMEESVANNDEFAVKIDHVSRIFFDTQGNPIPAVNDVSLGVKRGSIFGFLGANGAGKTTLIKIITSMLPPSNGHVFVNGVDIADGPRNNGISICPQFNSHLCMEMTVEEHFTLYKHIFGLTKREHETRMEKLIEGLGMDHYRGKIAGQLSGGEQRKLCIALAFYGPAEIILLDEPTSSLDPVARRNVHDMILSFKGEKTFMLCTHLLSEAEYLCDTLSMMIKGNVYTCGSPQYLSAKFGTEYKIDVNLKDDSAETSDRVDSFFKENLPQSVLTIRRQTARIYAVPSNSIELVDLFDVLETGFKEDSGYSYYTCSSSSLERVFMEIVHMSESGDFVNDGESP